MKTRDWMQNSPLGTNAISMEKPEDTLGIRKAFGDNVQKILNEQRRIKYAGTDRGVPGYNDFQQTTNGDVIVNPHVEIVDAELRITKVRIGKYETYHALNNLRSGHKNGEPDTSLEKCKYEVLSAGGVFYDPGKESFYLYKRPDDSQEAPGEVDLIGGCMNTTDGVNEAGEIDPTLYAASRLSAKGGIKISPESLEFMGIQKFQKRGFQNLVYLCVLESGQGDKLNPDRVSEIPLSEVDSYRKQDNPGGSGLTLALSHPMFEKKGYGKDVIQKIIDGNED